MPSVAQEWVNNLSYMQQSVLFSAIRAPDTLPIGHASKFLWRWLRRCVLLSAFDGRVLTTPDEVGGGSFTGPNADIDSVARDYLHGVDTVPHHAHLHLVHAAEIIGYKHPDPIIRRWWGWFYEEAVNDMHLGVESENQMDYRLGDNEAQWRVTERFPSDA